MLVTGLPGGGKTLTTVNVLENKAKSATSNIELIKFNAMSYSTQSSFFSDLYMQLFKKQVGNEISVDGLASALRERQ